MILLNEIAGKVNEELGISNEVTDAVNHLISLVANDIRRLPTQHDYFKSGKIKNAEFFGKKCTLTYNVLYVSTRNAARYARTPGNIPGYYDEFDNVFHTTLFYLGDEHKYVDFKGVTQHEMEHFFQLVKTGKTTFLNPEQNEMYFKGANLLRESDYGKHVVGLLIYYSCRFEETAFVNTLYRMIMNQPNDDPISVVKSTSFYNNIMVLKRAVSYCDQSNITNKGKQIEAACRSEFGKSLNWFVKLTNKTVKRYMRGFGRAITKAKLDLERANNGENEA